MRTTLHDNDWRLVEHDLFRFFFKFYFLFLFFCWHRHESDREEAALCLAMSRRNIPYTPHTCNRLRALSRRNDRLTRLSRKAAFDLHAGEERQRAKRKYGGC